MVTWKCESCVDNTGRPILRVLACTLCQEKRPLKLINIDRINVLIRRIREACSMSVPKPGLRSLYSDSAVAAAALPHGAAPALDLTQNWPDKGDIIGTCTGAEGTKGVHSFHELT